MTRYEFTFDGDWAAEFEVEETELPVPPSQAGQSLLVPFPGSWYTDPERSGSYSELKLTKEFSGVWPPNVEFYPGFPMPVVAVYDYPPLTTIGYTVRVSLNNSSTFVISFEVASDSMTGVRMNTSTDEGSDSGSWAPGQFGYRGELAEDGVTYNWYIDGGSGFLPDPIMSMPVGSPGGGDLRVEVNFVRHWQYAGVNEELVRPDKTLSIDQLALEYVSAQAASLAAARWNNARYDLAGAPTGSNARFTPA